MKHKYWLSIIFSFLSFSSLKAQDNQVIGKVICGYQGWFNCYSDNSPVERWVHWSSGVYRSNEGLPSPGHLNFEFYPEISGYDSTSLFQTAFDSLGDGRPALLFSSYKQETINKHFEWMKQYGIDGVAVQKFLTSDGVFERNRDSVAVRVGRAAEKYDRIFYMMYDMKASDSTIFFNDVLRLEEHGLISSPAYAKQNGKPVICIWGFGFNSRPDLPETSLNIINWLKNKDYFVIGGVPTNWRNGTNDSWADYSSVYMAFDMISPWTVGRYSDAAGINNYKNNYLIPDKSYCDSKNIEYQPVVFPGFAWSNWKDGYEQRQNQIPRNKGEFFWKQFYNIKGSGITNMYVAMFDEYDEGTAILKAADSYFDIPSDQYFLTTSADGTYISSDFYLRLTGKATRVLKGIDLVTSNVTIPYSTGPIFFRTSMEAMYDASPTWDNHTSLVKNVGGAGNNAIPRCMVVSEDINHTGNYALKYLGSDNSSDESYCYFDVFDVDIPVYDDTKLTFWNYPLNSNGKYVAVDLLMTDGSSLTETNATDINGITMEPSVGKGNINTWSENICNIGQWLQGKTIDKIRIVYKHNDETGEFSGYIDDISITTDNMYYTGIKVNKENILQDFKVYPVPAKSNMLTIEFNSQLSNDNNIELTLFNIQGKAVINQVLSKVTVTHQVPINNLAKGIYILVISTNTYVGSTKIVIE